MTTRRTFLRTAAAMGTVTLLPFRLNAAGHSADSFDTVNGAVTIHPIAHASFVMETPAGVVYVDPVGDAVLYEDMPAADFILITHEHGDHYNAETLAALATEQTAMISNPAVYDMLPENLQALTTAIANGESARAGEIGVEAIPAYNITEDRLNFHPQGRDNGYVVSVDGLRVYISGDTEDTPEMRALENIDVAFVCMNLPFTMDLNAAASAVAEFAPTYVYPYHYRGRDGGTQDPEEFASLLTSETEVKMGNWYS
ncbi:L-ascorbate metabolism protein UlaG (beta-lactamase superfamily) [Yoonia maritima]|uniref:L-ascorbate metabolism protein UlaG (Beta-lactamase superfamily) n=1 Tax=Yoonia maritima TaxID=1435347 RepID=A0A2T0W1P4_9RHOB|nr:MBL fold metallo-hydrolase [Yoonia maritima]PRY78875.1 L-ascorbate metabolism protein UlaG (beta-lactamase superfamily) [Yoonia maritima]